MENLKSLCQSVCDLTSEVRTFIMGEFKKFDRDHIEYKGMNDMVSYVDKEAERRLVERLAELLPEAGFLAEEGSGQLLEGGWNWIVDPLDGTTNFIHGIPMFSISVALAHGPEMHLGVVHELNLDECFYASKGNGAFLNGKPIKVSAETNLSRGLIATGFPYHTFEKMPQYMNILSHMMEHSHGLRRLGSAAVDLAYVASGRFEGFFEYNLNPWDVAAGVCLVEEAGGTVTDFSGTRNSVFGRELIAGCAVQPQMLKIISENFYA